MGGVTDASSLHQALSPESREAPVQPQPSSAQAPQPLPRPLEYQPSALGGSPQAPISPRAHLASGFSPPARAHCSDAPLSHRCCPGFQVGEAGEAGVARLTRVTEQGPSAGMAWTGSWQRGDGKNCGIVPVRQAKGIEAHLL